MNIKDQEITFFSPCPHHRVPFYLGTETHWAWSKPTIAKLFTPFML